MSHLIDYTLHLADNALILGHRNSEWTGHGPILEQDIALSNISLDLIGQARNLYQYAARLINEAPESAIASGEKTVSEDTLAYLRDGWDFKNCQLVEQPNGDWGKTLLRQFFFSVYQFYLYEQLKNSPDADLAAIGEKSIREVSYHLRWSGEWVVRLGKGTAESHRRMLLALEELWPFTGELFLPADYESALAEQGIAADLLSLKPAWDKNIREVLIQATLTTSDGRSPAGSVRVQAAGKKGRHTEHLGYILAEMQFLQRAYPGCDW